MKTRKIRLLTKEAKQLFKASNRIDRLWRRLIILHRQRLISPEITSETQTAWDGIFTGLKEFIDNFGTQLLALEESSGVVYYVNRDISFAESKRRAIKDLKTLGHEYEVPRMYSLYGNDFLHLCTKLDLQLKICENYMFISPHAVFALDKIREGFLTHYEKIYKQIHMDDARHLRITDALNKNRNRRQRMIYV